MSTFDQKYHEMDLREICEFGSKFQGISWHLLWMMTKRSYLSCNRWEFLEYGGQFRQAPTARIISSSNRGPTYLRAQAQEAGVSMAWMSNYIPQDSGVSEWVGVIKFNGLSGDSGQRCPYSPCKPCNHSLYIGIIIFPHIDNTQSRGHN